MSIPIIRFEVEGMKHSLMIALREHSALMDSQVQQAVEDFCKPENIDMVMRNMVNEQMKRAVEEEVRNFFSYGDGRRAVRDAVHATLSKDLK